MTDTDNTLNERLVRRLNIAVGSIAEGRQMQSSHPFVLRYKGAADEHIALRVDTAPRDVEILVDILEQIADGRYRKTSYSPTLNDVHLPSLSVG